MPPAPMISLAASGMPAAVSVGFGDIVSVDVCEMLHLTCSSITLVPSIWNKVEVLCVVEAKSRRFQLSGHYLEKATPGG